MNEPLYAGTMSHADTAISHGAIGLLELLDGRFSWPKVVVDRCECVIMIVAVFDNQTGSSHMTFKSLASPIDGARDDVAPLIMSGTSNEHDAGAIDSALIRIS